MYDSGLVYTVLGFLSAGPGSSTLLTLLLQVEIYKSFRPGDIVLAKVVSFTCSKIQDLFIKLISYVTMISALDIH